MHPLKSIHLLAGIVGLVVFVLTGQYMAIVLRGLAELPDGPRLLYRTSHLYLMWSALLNLVVGFYFVAASQRGPRIVQTIASVALLAGLPLILIGFFIESPANNLSRQFCGMANYLALGGALLHVIATASDKRQPKVDA
jgi:hypothetical protein